MPNPIMKISFVNRRILMLSILALFAISSIAGSMKEYTVSSPDKRIQVKVLLAKDIRYTIFADGMLILKPSAISMTLLDGTVLGDSPVLKGKRMYFSDSLISTAIYKKQVIADRYNYLILNFKGDYSVEFRVYDDGVAYRFITNRSGNMTVKSERAEFDFEEDYPAWIQYANQWGKGDKYYTTFENSYVNIPLSKAAGTDSLIVAPVVIDLGNKKVAITESGLEDYPGMFLQRGAGDYSFCGAFAGVPRTTSITSGEPVPDDNLEAVVSGDRHDYIAITTGTRTFPWRTLVIVDREADLANNDMVYKLAAPSRISDQSFIKPGKVAWDWWIENDLWNVDFKVGVNYDTYREYINFAAENKLEYILIDVGFSATSDIMLVNKDLRIAELVKYADDKNVGIIVWAGWLAIKDQMDAACAKYSSMGIKGMKIDFMNRDDQEVVNFYFRMAEIAAKYHLVLDFHGASIPAGMQRTWPNVLTWEGVKGQEWCRWTNPDQPRHAVTFPFIRMLEGPVDFTPGVFRSESKERFKISWIGSMGQGTRAHQMAMYMVFESPLQMLSDSPSRYREQQECTGFIAQVPAVWDETRALDGKIGEFIVMARRTGVVWYIGALTSWTARELDIDFSFLPSGQYSVELFRDGANADRYAQDYKREVINIAAGAKLIVKLASGGGWTARITPIR
jgi:alpha-glucosidase